MPAPGIEKLRCPGCADGSLAEERAAGGPVALVCAGCRVRYPLREGRFPDFLTDTDRARLAEELAFWNDHAGHTPYADESEASYRQWAEWMGSSAESSVLEIGCGSGALLQRVAGTLKVGLEPALALLRPSAGFLGVLGNAERLPFVDSSFDLVFFKHSLHHVQDKALAFREAVRVTREGGTLVVIEPNARHPQRRLISNPDGFFRRLGLLSRFIGPVETFQTVEELLEFGRRSGLQTLDIRYHQSRYDRLTFRQALQRLYASGFKRLLPEAWLLPNYLVRFRKS